MSRSDVGVGSCNAAELIVIEIQSTIRSTSAIELDFQRVKSKRADIDVRRRLEFIDMAAVLINSDCRERENGIVTRR